jgi:diguanylate cyclase (GGDEF)-like protein
MSSALQHIILVDDSQLNLRTHTLLLSRLENVAVHGFSSSREALEWLKYYEADCFIIDFHMPAPNGIELARTLRKRPATWLTPIIMVTSDRDRDVRYEALDAGVNDFVEKPVDPREFTSRVGTFLELHAARKRLDRHVGDLTTSLRDEEQRSREHAARLEVLWKVATNPLLDGEELLGAVLAETADALRPGEIFVARLFRLDGDHATLEAACDKPLADGLPVVQLGTRISLTGSNVGIARDRGRAVAWDDVEFEPTLAGYARPRELGIHSQVIAPFRAAGVDYALTYISSHRTARTFGSDDLTYATIVASFLQQLYQQRWQSDRIQHQMQFDALTGLMNRARFRALTRVASNDTTACAIAVVDIVGMSEINRVHGNLTGDAMLVEVAAALAEVATDGEFVGRLGGDAFGIALPGAQTDVSLRLRLERYLRVFDRQFSSGDREGTEFIPVSARIGGAVGRAGLSFNDLLARADLAIKGSHHVRASHVTIYDDVIHGAVSHIG